MSILGGLAADIAGGLVGKLLGGKKKGVDLVQLRADAEAAGFNPLTVLGATGAAGYQRDFNPALSSGSFVADAIAQSADSWFNAQTNDAQLQQVRAASQAADLKQSLDRSTVKPSFGYSLTSHQVATSPVSNMVAETAAVGPALRPKGNPLYPHNRDKMIVLEPDGTATKIDSSVARRLGVQPFDMLSAGDMTELRGEAWGEAETALEIGAINDATFDSVIVPPPLRKLPPLKWPNKKGQKGPWPKNTASRGGGAN